MQIKVRRPVALDVTPGDESAFVIRFVTENEHEAVVTLSRELLPELIAKLAEIDATQEEPKSPEIAKDEETRRVLLRALSASATRAA
jgi:hypothetical protein